MGTSKQDRQAVRTATQLEQKHGFGKSFAEVYELANDARKSAEEANSKFDNMTQEQIFNLLTTDGENQGLFRDDDGNVYINASYIATGDIRFTKDVFIDPGTSEAAMIRKHLDPGSPETIPEGRISLYDFDGDGVLTENDASIAMQCASGTRSLAHTWGANKKTEFSVMINFFDEENTIRYTGTDLWGKKVDKTVGLRSASLQEENGGCMYRMEGDAKEWLNPPKELQREYRTTERFRGNPVYVKVFEFSFGIDVTEKTVTTLIDYGKHTVIGINCTYNDGYSVWSPRGDVAFARCFPGDNDCYDLNVNTSGYGVCYVEIKYI